VIAFPGTRPIVEALSPRSGNEDSETMKLATIILTAALTASSSFALAQSGAGAGGSAGAGSTGTVGSTAGSSTSGSNTSGMSNGAGSYAAGQNSTQNPSGNSYINPPAGTAPGPAGRR